MRELHITFFRSLLMGDRGAVPETGLSPRDHAVKPAPRQRFRSRGTIPAAAGSNDPGIKTYRFKIGNAGAAHRAPRAIAL
jgi:hypothetical protein